MGVRECRLSALPPWFARVFGTFILASLVYLQPRLDALEVFAGDASVKTAFNEGGCVAEGWDYASDPRHDVLALSGVKLLIQRILQIKCGGLLWFTPYQ
jgi:hypothetical protein